LSILLALLARELAFLALSGGLIKELSSLATLWDTYGLVEDGVIRLALDTLSVRRALAPVAIVMAGHALLQTLIVVGGVRIWTAQHAELLGVEVDRG
jgi:nicotinamide riboside transporter PnuC